MRRRTASRHADSLPSPVSRDLFVDPKEAPCPAIDVPTTRATPRQPHNWMVRGRWPQHSLRSAPHWSQPHRRGARQCGTRQRPGRSTSRRQLRIASRGRGNPGQPGAARPAGAGVQGTGTVSAQGNGGVDTQAGASAGSQPGGHAGAQAGGATTHGQAGGHAGSQAGADTHGQAGGHAEATAHGQAGGHAAPQAGATTQGQAGRPRRAAGRRDRTARLGGHAATQAGATTHGRAARRAAARAAHRPGGRPAGATTHSQAGGHTATGSAKPTTGTRERPPVDRQTAATHKPIRTHRPTRMPVRAPVAGRHAQAQAAGSGANTRQARHTTGTWPCPFRWSRLHRRTGHGPGTPRGRPSDRSREGEPRLDAAIRAEARAAAREEVRERYRSNETVNGARTRFVIKGTAGRGSASGIDSPRRRKPPRRCCRCSRRHGSAAGPRGCTRCSSSVSDTSRRPHQRADDGAARAERHARQRQRPQRRIRPRRRRAA